MTMSSTSTNILLSGAPSPTVAQLRAAGVRNRTDRPSDRRSSPEPGSTRANVVRAPIHLVPIHVERADTLTADALTFNGCASVTDTPYAMWDAFGEYTETVTRGAFAKTLLTPNLDVPLVIDHDPGRRLARTLVAAGQHGHLDLAETETGLMATALLDPADPDVAYIAPKLRSGLIDEMSFRFRIIAGQWSPDWTEYHISEVDIHRGDVAIVAYGASPTTWGELRVPFLVTDSDLT